MALGLGHASFLGIAEESVWGTPVARTDFIEYNQHSIGVEERKLISPSLYRIGTHKNRIQRGAVAVGGDIVFNPQYEGWLKILKHAMGGLATIAIDPTNAATVHQHTFTIADALPNGLTLELQEDPATSFVVEGCKVDQIAFRISTESLMEVTASVVGQDVNAAAASTPTFDTTTPIIKDSDATLTWNAGSVCVKEAEIVLANNLTRDRRCLADRLIKEPVRGGKLAVSGRFVAEFDSTTLYDDFRNGTFRALRLRFTDGIAASPYNFEFDMQLNVSLLMGGALPPVDDAGPIIAEYAFASFRDDSDSELKIIVINTSATV